MRFSVGDAHALDEPDDAFDAVRSERTLQWLADPAAAVAEMVRVVRPGGRVSLIDTDWSTFTIDVGDDALAALVRDGMRTERHRPSNVGGRLHDLVRAAGCTPLASTSATQTWTTWDPDESLALPGCFSMESLADDLVAFDLLATADRGRFIVDDPRGRPARSVLDAPHDVRGRGYGADMTRYLVLLRGINVGGRNKLPMAALRELLESHGHTKVSTYIASGNVILSSDRSAAAIKRELEEALPKTFKLDSELISVLILTLAQLRAVVRKRPKGFGDHPETYHSDAVFLIDIDASTAMKVFDPRPGVDEVWPGTGVIYSQRLSAERTKSRLSKIVGTPAYKSMTIRSWQTTLALLERMEAPEADADPRSRSAPLPCPGRRQELFVPTTRTPLTAG